MNMQALKAVQIVDAVKRKPSEHRRQSFFGMYDLWEYIAVYDDVLCEKCYGFAEREVYRGSHLRAIFPYLEIHDENRIDVHVHPHCRCMLLRILDIRRYFRMITFLEERGR